MHVCARVHLDEVGAGDGSDWDRIQKGENNIVKISSPLANHHSTTNTDFDNTSNYGTTTMSFTAVSVNTLLSSASSTIPTATSTYSHAHQDHCICALFVDCFWLE